MQKPKKETLCKVLLLDLSLYPAQPTPASLNLIMPLRQSYEFIELGEFKQSKEECS
jgi:hypothetical protein